MGEDFMDLNEKIERKEMIKEIINIPESSVVRLDKEHAEYIEIIRALYTNQFVSPRTTDIIKIVLKWYVNEKMDSQEVALAYNALQEKLREEKS